MKMNTKTILKKKNRTCMSMPSKPTPDNRQQKIHTYLPNMKEISNTYVSHIQQRYRKI